MEPWAGFGFKAGPSRWVLAPSARPGATACALAAWGSVPQLLYLNGREHKKDYLAEHVIDGQWASQKSQGGRVGEQRACTVARGSPDPGSIIHALVFAFHAI